MNKSNDFFNTKNSFLDNNVSLFNNDLLLSNIYNYEAGKAIQGPRSRRINKLESAVFSNSNTTTNTQSSSNFSNSTANNTINWNDLGLDPNTANFCATANTLESIKYCEQLRNRILKDREIYAEAEKNKKKIKVASALNTAFNVAGMLTSAFVKRMPGPQKPFVRNTGYDYAIQNTKNAEQAYKETLFANLYNINEKFKQYGTTNSTNSLLAANSQILNSLNKGLPAFANQMAALLKERGANLAEVENKNIVADYKYRQDNVEARLTRVKDVLLYAGQGIEGLNALPTALFNVDSSAAQLSTINHMYPNSAYGGKRRYQKIVNKPMFKESNKYC